jgi:L-aminopeptidase/D-esterase-like protein
MKPKIAVLVCAAAAAGCAAPPSSRDRNLTLTAVDGLKVGHFTLAERPTGCTVVLATGGTIGAVDVRGAAPGTRETDVLNPLNNVRTVNAILFSGGSAYGLDAASGVMKWLEEHHIGQPAGLAGVVPIVPSAVLIDLWFGGSPRVRPGPDCGYRAASVASGAPVQEGNIGAGAGATVGKSLGYGSGKSGPMKAGIGSSAIARPDGLIVAAMVAVNALGDIIDPETGRVLAGARDADGRLADARRLLRAGTTSAGRAGGNTTLGVVATNARLTNVQAQKVAQMAHDGYARAISPIHTLADGDTIFSLATGTWNGQASEGLVGALAAEAIADAIVRAAVRATASHGLPAARDLGTVPSRFKP